MLEGENSLYIINVDALLEEQKDELEEEMNLRSTRKMGMKLTQKQTKLPGKGEDDEDEDEEPHTKKPTGDKILPSSGNNQIFKISLEDGMELSINL
jgi:hypothetical protein